MAEENKSWFPNIGLLSESSLQGMGADLQDQLQREATKRMVLGGLLSGRADVGFQSAVGVPADYAARQNQIVAMNQLAATGRAREASMVPTTMGVVPGSEQAKMLAQDVTDFGPDALRTVNALYSNRNLPKRFDESLFAQNIKPILAGTDPLKWAEFQKNTRPVPMEPGSIVVDAFDPTKILTQMPGGLEKGMQWGINPVTGAREVQLMPGFATGVAERTKAETTARETSTPRAGVGKSGAQIFTYPPAPPSYGGTGTGVTPSAAPAVVQEPPQTANDIALQKGASEAYQDFRKRVTDAASQAQESIMSNKAMYDIASKIDGNKFTGITAEAASYMRGLPFVGDKYDSYVSDVRMFAKEQSKQTLAGLNSIKQGANVFEGDVVQRGTSDIKDPKLATRMGAAYAIATAEKNMAAREFIDKYDGPAGQAETAWSKSPSNPRIYNHPLVNQTLVEQVVANPSNPQLPSGYKIVPRSAGDGVTEYGFKKPDGSVTPFATMQNGKITYKSFGQ